MGRLSVFSCLLASSAPFALDASPVASATAPRPPALGDLALLPAYSLPLNDSRSPERSLEIAAKQVGYLYGPPVGGGPFFPAGVLGLGRRASDQAEVLRDEEPSLAAIAVDARDSMMSEIQYHGLQSLDDYALLYDGHWNQTLPSGPVPGMLTNYTQDLLFSMERLSLSPYQVKRLNPSSHTLPFKIEDRLATELTGMTLRQLLECGRLFYADYRSQQDLTPTDRHSAACDAFFYIDATSGDFLPLAIRTNVGSSLVYTPRDQPADWLLAKIMYNVNDFWFAQWNHLAGTHEVVQIVYLAAIRTLSDQHPVLALLNRLMYEVYAIQPLAETLLFRPGAAVDQLFAYTGASARRYTTAQYEGGGSGRFHANYFLNDLEARGLINSDFGPALDRFPFYEDASVISEAIRVFMTCLVRSYYSQDSHVTTDAEIQAWVKEAQGPAEVFDFPPVTTKDGLIAVLSHMVSARAR